MIREMLYDTGLSARKVNAIENGFIEAYLNLDVQRRLSLGNIPFLTTSKSFSWYDGIYLMVVKLQILRGHLDQYS